MTTSIKKVAFNLQNMGKSFAYDDNNYDDNYAKVTQHKSISHGTDFNQYQMGLKNKATYITEGFNVQNDLSYASQSVLSKTQMSTDQQQELDRLKQEYDLNQIRYNSLINTISPTDNSDKLKQLALLETTLDLLTQQINALNDLQKNNVASVNDQISTNSIAREKYMSDITRNNTNEANMIDISNNIQNILNDSNIVTLQKNYSYILLSILAAASVLVAMNVINKN
jgi:hypothetical protein